MKKFAFVFATLGMVWGLARAEPCFAFNAHSYVSGKGGGTLCTLATPCADLGTALGATLAEGEISCLDGGPSTSFAAISISQSVTIDCAGVSAAVSHITINGAGIVVTLRNLTVMGNDTNGIDFQNGGALFVEKCVIQNYAHDAPGTGIRFTPSSGTAALNVTDSVIKNNGVPIGPAKGGGGIIVQPAAGVVAAVTIERTHVESNLNGIYANSGSGGTVHGVVRGSVVSGSTNYGITAVNSGTRLLIENTTVTANQIGLVATTNANMMVNRSGIVLNNTGLRTASGGTLSSYKTNNVNNNTSADGAFTSVLAVK
jgi:hypothetical protein